MSSDLGSICLCFTGTHSKPRAQLMQECYDADIPTSEGVRARTTHVVATPNEIAANTSKIQAAISKGKHIVTEDFMHACIAAGHVVNHDQYMLKTGVGSGGTGGGASKPSSSAGKTKYVAPKGNSSSAAEACKVLLAKKWDEGMNPTGWWMSEKLDGVRAYWDGKNFYSRNGNIFPAPPYFKNSLPDTPLDGELWAGRGQFQQALSIAKSGSGDMERWKCVSYAVFDAPKLKNAAGNYVVFEERMAWLKDNIKPGKTKFASAVVSIKCEGVKHLKEELQKAEDGGAEGLMLRQPKSQYAHGRDKSLLKVKSFHDEEGIVTGYEGGKGKNCGLVGAIWLETPDKRKLKVGTGMTDHDRKNPPKVGAIVTYKYFEVNGSGHPRFPVFVGERKDLDWADYCKTYEPPKANSKTGKLKRRHTIMFGPKIGRLGSLLDESDGEDDSTSSAGSKRKAGDAGISGGSQAKKHTASLIPAPSPSGAKQKSTYAQPAAAEHQSNGGQWIQVFHASLMDSHSSAIVSSCGSAMNLTSGLAGAISKAAGPEVQKECKEYVKKNGLLTVGDAVVTTAGNLPCDQILHTLAPTYDKDESIKSYHKLLGTIQECLVVAESLSLPSISIPAIGTGAQGFPRDLAARAIISAAHYFCMECPESTLSTIAIVAQDKLLIDELKKEMSMLPRTPGN
eukprot:m.70352 g.70352  ORF g.70352 m.70352 type:complete len:678 (+) comp12124_c0_seq2:98-2131(+)